MQRTCQYNLQITVDTGNGYESLPEVSNSMDWYE